MPGQVAGEDADVEPAHDDVEAVEIAKELDFIGQALALDQGRCVEQGERHAEQRSGQRRRPQRGGVDRLIAAVLAEAEDVAQREIAERGHRNIGEMGDDARRDFAGRDLADAAQGDGGVVLAPFGGEGQARRDRADIGNRQHRKPVRCRSSRHGLAPYPVSGQR
ncbi:hypothetical protein GGR44_001925 [Sphingobium fontiphilum]|uniref:Uncharacterized protein n=1 Tax=Sphingobium fontiphilum TaxID=944425 RepID=A0A7W6GP75_9SPHN|nr:hypothetical protein [Sphingobium fontiphilum]MBB3982262.1 hypothetical protein [Sphingobium fontiphilum]